MFEEKFKVFWDVFINYGFGGFKKHTSDCMYRSAYRYCYRHIAGNNTRVAEKQYYYKNIG